MADSQTERSTVPISLRGVDAELWRSVRIKALELGISLRAYVEQSLRDSLKRKEKQR